MRVAPQLQNNLFRGPKKYFSTYTSYHPSADHRTRIREKCAGENAVGIMA